MSKTVIALLLSLIVALGSVYTVTLYFQKDEEELPEETVNQIAYYKEIGDEQLLLGGYGKACECYENILSLDPSIENYLALSDVYVEAKRYTRFTELMRTAISVFPQDNRCYEKLAQYYLDTKTYKSCKEITEMAFDNSVSNDLLKELYYASAFQYETYFAQVPSASRFYNGFSVTKKDDGYYYLNTNMRFDLGPFEYATAFTDTLAAVRKEKGKYYYIDLEGEKYLSTSEDYEIAYSFCEGFAIVKTEEGKYRYLSTDNKLQNGYFEAATLYKNGVAMAKYDGAWYLINTLGGKVEENKSYYDVKIDEDNICSNNGIIFVSDGEGKGYYPIDLTGARIGTDTYDDAKPFFTGELAPVMKDEKWGFIDATGKLVIDYQYQDAQPFGCDAAAVKTGNKWGFVSSENVMVIEAQYEDAKCFSGEEKFCPVKIDGVWSFKKFIA